MAHWLLPVAAVMVVLFAPLAGECGIQVLPVSMSLSETQHVGAFTIRNDGADPVVIQVKTFGWAQRDGVDQHVPTEAPLVVPPIFTIPAFGEQIVRFGLHHFEQTTQETTYRVIFTPVPSADAHGSLGVSILYAFDIPVFVEPLGRRYADLSWTISRAGGRHFALHAHNDGTIHRQIRSVRLLNRAGAVISTINGAGYVLARANRTWPLDLSATTEAVSVEVDALDGVTKSPVSAAP